MVLFGNLSVCKSTIWRKLKTSLKKTNETAAHERPQQSSKYEELRRRKDWNPGEGKGP